jgi:hypothetical protein
MNLIDDFPIIWTVLLVKDKFINLQINLKTIYFRAREISNRTKANM